MTGARVVAIVAHMQGEIDKRDPAIRTRIADGFTGAIPHNEAIGLTLVDAGPPDVQMQLAWRADFLGQAEGDVWHTGIAATAADSACGLAVFLTLPGLEAIATLDLRMDHLRPAVAGEALLIVARCHHVTRRMAFASAVVHQGDAERPTARATATFTRTGKSVMPS